jgi:hypothetical protein
LIQKLKKSLNLTDKNEREFYYFIAIHAVAATLALTTCGCASANKSIGLGGSIGAGTGAVLGGIADPGKKGEYRTRNVIIGSALGGMAGMIAGARIYENTAKQKQEAYKQGQKNAPAVDQDDSPNLIPAKWRAEVIETRRIGNRLIPRHIEYVIIEPARWEEVQ